MPYFAANIDVHPIDTKYPATIFCPKMPPAFTSAEYIQDYFRLDFFMKANNMKPIISL